LQSLLHELDLLHPVQRSAETPNKSNEAKIPSCFFIKVSLLISDFL
jgi:hypothetical protein